MSIKLKDIVGDIFNADKKSATELQRIADLKQITNNMFGGSEESANKSSNPFLNSNGELINSLLDYQRLLDNPKVSQKTKDYIAQATGLSSTLTKKSTSKPTIKATRGGTSSKKQTGTTQKATATGNSIADAAQGYIGTPYVWGGESMAEGGMDCSGFVYNALKDAGYNVGRTTAQGYRNQGTSVSKDNMQPGDLVFYGKNGEATHVGVYIGNGQMVHSSGNSKNTASNPGKGVTITNVDYRSDFLGAKRY